MGALLQNSSPGLCFTSADMLRNAYCSSLMHLPLHVQERKYNDTWLQWLEVPAMGDAKVLSGFMLRYVEAAEEQQQKGEGSGDGDGCKGQQQR